VIEKIIPHKSDNPFDNLLFFFFSIYPITFLLGNFAINLFLFIFNFILILGFFRNYYNFKVLNRHILYLLSFLFLSFVINLIFSNNFNLSYPRVLKFILIIGSIISFKQLLLGFKSAEINKLYKIWSIIFVIVVFDIVFELIFKSNIIGLESFMPGRVASFSGKELNIGHFFSAFCLIFMSFIYINFKNISINLIIGILLIAISFLIGERSNFVKTLLIISAFIFLIHEIKVKFKILSLTSLIIFFMILLILNPAYKLRYFDQFTKVLTKEGINYYFDNTVYGAHYNVAKEIFKDNKVFGAGIKNFRIESFSKKYSNLDHKQNDRRANTHPHQIHYEFLSETGLLGYLSFIFFICFSLYLAIKTYFQNRNLFQLSAIFYVLISLLPLLPSGSFFSTYTSSLFWLNYAIMVGYIKKGN
jgi:O-antigen ligase